MVPPDKVQYTARVHTTGSRDGGASRSSNGRLDIKLPVPGTLGTGTTPEQLLAAGWSSYFGSSVKIVAGGMKIKLLPDLAVDAEVDPCRRNDVGFFLFRLRSTSACRVSSANSLTTSWLRPSRSAPPIPRHTGQH